MIKKAAKLISLVSAILVAYSAHADYIFSSPMHSVESSQHVELMLTVTNTTNKSQHVEVSNPLHVKVDAGTATAVIDLSADEPLAPFELAPGNFRSIKLHGDLPKLSEGVVTLAPTGIEANTLVLNVLAPAAAEASPTLVTTSTPAKPTSAELEDKPPVLALSVYEPVYFIIGDGGGFNAKFQISFKYRLFDEKGAVARHFPWIDDLYLGYSQTSLWLLGEHSSPFRDSSYRPRLFYADDKLFSLFDGRLRVGLESGLGHESNGKSGADSRSINIAFAKPMLTWGDVEARHFYLAPMIFGYLERSDNPDIVDYRGHVELLVGYGSKGGVNVWTTLRKGKASNYASMEFNASYPLARLSHGGLSGWLLFQYFDGYGESLLDYNQKLDSQFRVGLAIAL